MNDQVTVDGCTRSVAAWSRATGVPARVIRDLLARGVAAADAVDPSYVDTARLNTVDPATVHLVDPGELGLTDLTGRTFSELTVVGLAEGRRNDNTGARWLCRCSCGRFTVAKGRTLRVGRVKSCGHLRLWNGGDRARWVTNRAPVTPVHDLTGRTFGRLTVVTRAEGPWAHAHWRCRCACGGEAVVDGAKLRSGRTRSCGCLRGRRPRVKSTHPEYRHWRSMHRRCADAGNQVYGGRGITVCPEWADFWTFLADVGPKPGPGYTLGRLDNDRGYEPGNVVWADRVTQANHTRRAGPLEFNGVTRPVAEWARMLGLTPGALRDRLRRGWTLERALTTPRQTAAKVNKHRATHDRNHVPEHSAWRSMIRRCTDPAHRVYAAYGGRGIRVYDRWACGPTGFKQFLADVGPRPGKGWSLDRINNDGDYEPGNVRWATATQQANNRRTNRLVDHDGVRLTITQWARRLKISPAAFAHRLQSSRLTSAQVFHVGPLPRIGRRVR